MLDKDSIGGLSGSLLTVFAATGITTEVVQIIYYILGGIGFLITIISTVLRWYNKAKKDGKITSEEVEELLDDVKKDIEENKKDE